MRVLYLTNSTCYLLYVLCIIAKYVADSSGCVTFSDETNGLDNEVRPMSASQEEER